MNGQKQLFPSAPYMSPQARYPRGFTPERQDQVLSALSGAQFIVDRHRDTDASDRPRQHRAVFQRHVVETLARSTVPMGEMAGLQKVRTPTQQERRNGPPASYRYGDVTEVMTQYVRPGKPRSGLLGRADRVEAEQQLVHEMGHHLSAYGGARPDEEWASDHHAVGRRGGSFQQEEEAFADDHMVRHYRPHPLDAEVYSLKRTPSYYSSGSAREDNAPHYVAARTVWAPDEIKKRQERSGRSDELKKGAMGAQMTLPGMGG